MEIKDCIGVYKNCLSPKQVSAFIRFFKEKHFRQSSIIRPNGEQVVDTTNRCVEDYNIDLEKSITETHWYQYIKRRMFLVYQKYREDKKILPQVHDTQEITLLKYSAGGFYKVHVDSSAKIPREISVIIFLNNDYEGGHLHFYDTEHKKIILDIKPEIGTMVIWPSSFLFPHAAAPTTKGTRFVIVSWLS